MFNRKPKNNQRFLRGGYRKFRNPSIFRASQIKPRKEFKIPKVPFKTIIYTILAVFVLYYLFISSNFKIKDVIIEGNQMVSSEKIVSEVSKGSNILLFNANKIKNKILKNNPEIKNIEIYRGLPDAIKVVVLEHECKLIWQSGDGSYLISTQGKVAKKINPEENYLFPRVIDKKNVAVDVGSSLLSPSFVAFINNIYNQFYNVTNINPKDFEVNETTFDVNLMTEAGFYVKFNSLRSSAKQLDNLKKVLVEKRPEIKEYVDLRIDGWAYYK